MTIGSTRIKKDQPRSPRTHINTDHEWVSTIAFQLTHGWYQYRGYILHQRLSSTCCCQFKPKATVSSQTPQVYNKHVPK